MSKMKVIVDIYNNNNVVKQIKRFKVFNIGTVSTTLDDLMIDKYIEIDENIIPILQVIDLSGIVHNYIIKNLNRYRDTGDYVAEIEADDLLEISSSDSSSSLPYRIYAAHINQSVSAAPTASVKQNTLECNVTYAYSSVGTYLINFSSPILTPTNWAFLRGCGNNATLPEIWCFYVSPTQLRIQVYDLANVGPSNWPSFISSLHNSLLDNQFIEIRVYN